jgi:hypothetical protein
MSEPTAPLKTEGCLPRESFQGKSDSLYLAHFLERCIHIIQLLLLRPPLNFFTLPSSSPSLLNSSFYSHSYQSPRLLILLSIPHSTLIHISPLDYSFFSHYPEFRALLSLSSIIRSSLFTLRFLISSLNHNRAPMNSIDLRIAELVQRAHEVLGRYRIIQEAKESE